MSDTHIQNNTPHPLSVNTNYELLVVDVLPPKQIKKSKYPGVPFYVFKVYFHDPNRKLYVGEYVQPNSEVQTKFVKDKVVKFHVTIAAGINSEIEEGHILPSSSGGTPSARPAMNASGQTYTFAMGYAKDVFCAMIAAGKIEDDPDSPENMERLVSIAKMINNGLIEMQEEQQNRM